MKHTLVSLNRKFHVYIINYVRVQKRIKLSKKFLGHDIFSVRNIKNEVNLRTLQRKKLFSLVFSIQLFVNVDIFKKCST